MNIATKRIKEKTQEIIKSYDSLVKQIDEVSEWTSMTKVFENLSKVYNFTMNIVAAVELASVEVCTELETLKSEDKLNAAASVIDEAIQLPFYLELFDGKVIRLVLSLMVETLNQQVGEDWDAEKIKAAFANRISLIQAFK